MNHTLDPTPDNLVLGYFDAAEPPILTVSSGDTVTLTCWNPATERHLPPDRSVVDPLQLRSIAELPPGPGPHVVAGPVRVEGIEAGDVLQIDIVDVTLRDTWGFMAIEPGRGTLPDDFAEPVLIHPTIDKAAGTMRLPWGLELPLKPFFGIMAVAPAPELGRVDTIPPGLFGGNIDNKELVEGTTLYLPVFNDGALFSAGDGHGVQGDGEVCLTALETALTGTFRLTARKDLGYDAPFGETPTHIIGMGLDEDLDRAAEMAVRQTIDHICRRSSLTREEAYMLCSVAGDLHVTQTVDVVKGCHMMLPKALL